jgi:hypothetical protein
MPRKPPPSSLIILRLDGCVEIAAMGSYFKWRPGKSDRAAALAGILAASSNSCDNHALAKIGEICRGARTRLDEVLCQIAARPTNFPEHGTQILQRLAFGPNGHGISGH